MKKTMFIMDEPTTGLDESDIEKVIHVLVELKEKGSTIVIIEHNAQLVQACDYLIEVGPMGGENGGKIIRTGYIKKGD